MGVSYLESKERHDVLGHMVQVPQQQLLHTRCHIPLIRPIYYSLPLPLPLPLKVYKAMLYFSFL